MNKHNIPLDCLYIKELTQYSGSFTIVLEGSRTNKHGVLEVYTITKQNLHTSNILCCLSRLQNVIKLYYKEAEDVAKQFGVLHSNT